MPIKGEEAATVKGDRKLREKPREELERESYCIFLFSFTPYTSGKQSVHLRPSHLFPYFLNQLFEPPTVRFLP